MEDFRQLSPIGEPYVWLCHFMLPAVVGWKTWNKRKYKEPISDIASCSDESFVLLTLENNYDRWIAEVNWLVRNKDKEAAEKEPKHFPESRFTNSGKSKQNGRSKRLQGWAREGYLLFNNLYQRVAEDRKRRANFEAEIMTQLRATTNETNSDSEEEAEEDEIFPANDLDGVVAPVGAMVNRSNHDATYDPYDPHNE